MKDRKAFTTLEDDAERPRMPRKAVHEQKQLDLSAEAKSKPTIEMETEDQPGAVPAVPRPLLP